MSDTAILIGVGLLSGAINALAGGGSLISFPVLIGLGVPPLTANVTNAVAHLPGYTSIAYGYRRHLEGQAPRVRALALPGALGAAAGVTLLTVGGEGTFESVVPFLVLISCALLATGPLLRARLETRRTDAHQLSLPLVAAVAGGCLYAAYFGAAAGVMMLAILGLGISDTLQRLNGLNRALILLANAAALPFFLLLSPIDWAACAALAPATLIGGAIGAKYASRLDDRVLRAAVVTLGVCVATWLLVR
ncbi:MAG TPA: sulfite exporter TauE/SafE family protein [Baekduia sp.]|nr:sulfite exporter TauE/SafE family protein [Baekduia sp.]